MHEVPHLTVVVTWQADAVPAEFIQASPPTARRSDKPDPTDGPDERQRAQFQTIREWRSETARADGVPTYVVLTNRQLAEIVLRMPDSPSALATVPGIGKQTVRRYGRAIPGLLNSSAPAPTEAT